MLFWHDATLSHAESGAEDWKPMLHATRLLRNGPIIELRWAAGRGVLAARSETACALLVEHRLCRKVICTRGSVQ